MRRSIFKLLIVMVLLFTACGKTENVSDSVPEQEQSIEALEEMAQESMVVQEDTVSQELGSEESDYVEEPDYEEALESLSEEELEQLWNEMFNNLAYPSHKEEYVESIMEVLNSLPEEKPQSTLKQKDVDCDTLQWFNATYAMFVYSQGNDYHLIGGFNDEFNSRKDYLRDQLDKSWGITDRQTAIETLSWLATEGHAMEYASNVQMMDMAGMLDYTEAELAAYLYDVAEQEQISDEDRANLVLYYKTILNLNNTCPENGIDGWDYCRMMQISGNSYFAGYITLEECLSIQLAVSQAIQSQFDSWQEMNDSYYYGYSYWANGSYMVTFRKKAYDELAAAEDSPWKLLDFNMSLEKFW